MHCSSQDIARNIAVLLAEHDCVILPGFGGFIGNYAPARIDPVTHSFTPPSKRILFNINLRQNDGLLCNRLATTYELTYNEALSRVNDLTAAARHDLKSGKAFVIHGVGKLSPGREGTVQFEQEKDANLLPEAYGLSSFIAPPVLRNSYADRFGKGMSPRNEAPVRNVKRSLPRSLKWAAILAVPIGASAILGITQFDKLRNPSVDNAGILTSVFSRFSASSLVEKKEAPARQNEVDYNFGEMPSGISSPSTPASGASGDPDLDLLLNSARASADQISEMNTVTGLKTNNASLNASVEETRPKSGPSQSEGSEAKSSGTFNSSDRYVIIIGAFRMRENAEKCIRDAGSSGLEAAIYDRSRTGLYRVSLPTTNDRKQAEVMIDQARTNGFSGAWMLTK
jgi:cell division protein FtsN